jgi:hypothetical protein
VFARIFSKITLPSFKVKSTKEPPDEESRNIADLSLRRNLNYWRHVGSGIPKSDPEAKTLVNCAQTVPKYSPSFCLKWMISHRRSLIRASEKKVRQNVSLKTSHLPSTLRTLRLYHCFALPINENGKSIHFNVSCAIPSIVMHEQSCSNSLK